MMAKERWGNELLCIAISWDCMSIIRRLIDRAQYNTELRNELLRKPWCEPQTKSFRNPVHQLIGNAILGNYVDIVERLLGQQGIEIHLQYRNSRVRTFCTWHADSAILRWRVGSGLVQVSEVCFPRLRNPSPILPPCWHFIIHCLASQVQSHKIW